MSWTRVGIVLSTQYIDKIAVTPPAAVEDLRSSGRVDHRILQATTRACTASQASAACIPTDAVPRSHDAGRDRGADWTRRPEQTLCSRARYLTVTPAHFTTKWARYEGAPGDLAMDFVRPRPALSSGEYEAKFSSRMHSGRSEYVRQRSVKPLPSSRPPGALLRRPLQRSASASG
jgi:hypothetical protein